MMKRMDATASTDAPLHPPELPAEAWSVTEHGQVREDPYHWLNRLESPRVRAYLEANNRYTEAVLRRADPLRRRILAELHRLTPPDEGQAAWRLGSDWYRTRWLGKDDHPSFVRRTGSPDGPETILIDGPALARDQSYFALAEVRIAPDRAHLVYAIDTTGSSLHTLRFMDLKTGRHLPDRLADVDSLTAWAADSRTIFYVRPDPVTRRPCQVYRHRLGDDPARDALVYEERDETFRCFVSDTRSRRFILINCYSTDAEEVLGLDAADPAGPIAVLCPRAACEYQADHDGRRFAILTNRGAPHFRVCATDRLGSPPDTWQEAAAAAPGFFIERLAAFDGHLALVERGQGRERVRVIDRVSGVSHEVRFPDAVYHVWIDANPDATSHSLRLGYTSLVTPVSYYDYDMERRALRLVQREEIEGYDASAFETRLLMLPARDGVEVPVTLVGRRDVLAAGPAPALLFGYGAYGTNIPVYFDQSRLVLLNRGFVYAMVHVRGGSELGRAWYRAGRLLNKSNTFADFIAVAEALVRAGIARKDGLFAESLSAGGLLLGAVINMRPDLFRAIVAREPFVDLLNTMTNPDLPLTSFEYGEWGDPRQPEQWACMRAYSPYDCIAPRAYPHVLATAGFEDRQVPCWEPAKWVARLRAANTVDGGVKV